MKALGFIITLVGIFLGVVVAAEEVPAKAELLPTGVLRVAIAVGPAPSAIYAVPDGQGGFRGVTVDLGTALAERLGARAVFIPYDSTGEILAAAGNGVWDVSFMPVDGERKKFVDFGPSYHILRSSYLVSDASKLQSIDMANDPRIRIVGIPGTATFRASSRISPLAAHVGVASVAAAIEAAMAGKADVIAFGREALGGIAAKLPGWHVLDGSFLDSTTAIAVPKNKPAARAYVSAFIEDAKATGMVRRSLDAVGLNVAIVAPPGLQP